VVGKGDDPNHGVVKKESEGRDKKRQEGTWDQPNVGGVVSGIKYRGGKKEKEVGGRNKEKGGWPQNQAKMELGEFLRGKKKLNWLQMVGREGKKTDQGAKLKKEDLVGWFWYDGKGGNKKKKKSVTFQTKQRKNTLNIQQGYSKTI